MTIDLLSLKKINLSLSLVLQYRSCVACLETGSTGCIGHAVPMLHIRAFHIFEKTITLCFALIKGLLSKKYYFYYNLILLKTRKKLELYSNIANFKLKTNNSTITNHCKCNSKFNNKTAVSSTSRLSLRNAKSFTLVERVDLF